MLAKQSEELELERQALEDDKKLLLEETEKLKKEKAALENRERFFSTGFFASSLAAGIAILGILLRLPTSRLERKLKRLEIAALEAKLAGVIPSDKDVASGNA